MRRVLLFVVASFGACVVAACAGSTERSGSGGSTASGGSVGTGATGGSGASSGSGGGGALSCAQLGGSCQCAGSCAPGFESAGEADCPQPCANCGGCSMWCCVPSTDAGACVPGSSCSLPHATGKCSASGACAIEKCEGAWADCNAAAVDGCESDTDHDVAHCGGCGNACVLRNAIAACNDGVCSVVCGCQPGWLDCDKSSANCCEVNSKADPKNCGSCGNACPAGKACIQGSCQ